MVESFTFEDLLEEALNILSIDFHRINPTQRLEFNWLISKYEDLLQEELDAEFALGRDEGYDEGLSEGYDNGWNDAMESQD